MTQFPQVQHVDRIVVVAEGTQHQAPTVQSEHKTVDVPQSQYLDRVPAASHRQVPAIQTEQMMVEVRESHSFDRVDRRAVATQPQSVTIHEVTRTAMTVPASRVKRVTVARARRRTQSRFVQRSSSSPREHARHCAERGQRTRADPLVAQKRHGSPKACVTSQRR